MKYGKGCYNLGVLYSSGKGVKQDYKKANELYLKACNLKDGSGCYNIGISYYLGKGISQNISMAKKYFSKACDLGDQAGCDGYRKLNEQGF